MRTTGRVSPSTLPATSSNTTRGLSSGAARFARAGRSARTGSEAAGLGNDSVTRLAWRSAGAGLGSRAGPLAVGSGAGR